MLLDRPLRTCVAPAVDGLQGWQMPPSTGSGRRGRIYYGTQVRGVRVNNVDVHVARFASIQCRTEVQSLK